MTKQFTKAQKKRLRDVAAYEQERVSGGAFWRNLDFFIYLAVVVVIAFSIRAFLFEPIRVDGSSMTPTLLNREEMLVEKVSYWFGAPQRGDIVICYYPGYTESCVKRVVGLPGETVSVSGGKFYINGIALDESAYWNDEIHGDMEAVTVGESEVFVVGDNRNGSKDSRDSRVGAIPLEKVVGRVRMVIWPLANARSMG